MAKVLLNEYGCPFQCARKEFECDETAKAEKKWKGFTRLRRFGFANMRVDVFVPDDGALHIIEITTGPHSRAYYVDSTIALWRTLAELAPVVSLDLATAPDGDRRREPE